MFICDCGHQAFHTGKLLFLCKTLLSECDMCLVPCLKKQEGVDGTVGIIQHTAASSQLALSITKILIKEHVAQQ